MVYITKRAVIALARTFVFVGALLFAIGNTANAATIYAVGDSITRGLPFAFSANNYPESSYRLSSGAPPSNLRSYREHLHDLLADSSCNASVDWVGSKDEPNRVPEFHEGRSGWRADEIVNRTWAADGTSSPQNSIDEWLGVYQPDYVLIHLGTNDMQQGQTAESTRDDINDLIDIVYSERPNAKVFLANVIPIFGWWADHVNVPPYPTADTAGEAQQLSALINSLVTTRSNAGDEIYLVDVNSTFFVQESNVTNCATGALGNPANMSTSECRVLPDGSGTEPDGIHPNLVGDKFIADQFFTVMNDNTNICSMGGGGSTDAENPDVSITTPSSAGATLPSVAALAGSATDSGGSGFDRVEVSVTDSSGDSLNFATGAFTSASQTTDAFLNNTTTSSTDWSVTTPGLPDGSYTLEATAFDVAGNSDVSTRTFVVNTNSGGGGGSTSDALFQEAEAGTLSGAMTIVSDGAYSGGQFVRVPVGTSGSSNDYVEFTVNIETAGDYQVNAQVRGPSGLQNSFFAQIDGGAQILWDIPSTNVLVEDLVSNRGSGVITQSLSAGSHTLRISFREAGAQLDWIEFVLQ